MQCEHAREQLFDYLDRTLSPAMSQVIEHHLRDCDSCKAEYLELKSMYTLLEEGLPEVPVPTGFRASILSAISEQPKPQGLAATIQRWFIPQASNRMPVFGFGAAAVLVAAAFSSVVINRHAASDNVNQPTTLNMQGSMLPVENPSLPVQNNGVVQSINNYQNNGQIYHVLGLHLSDKAEKTKITTYVIQSADALTTPSKLVDPTQSTELPGFNMNPGTSYNLPIAVPSGVAQGKTLSLLSQWSESDGLHQEVSFIPLSQEAGQSGGVVVSNGESLYDSLASVAAAFDVTIIVSDTASSDLTKPISRGLDMSDATVNQSLADLTMPVNHSFTRQNDGSYVIR